MSRRKGLPRRQVIALVIFVIWAVLLLLRLFGQDIAVPRTVTVPAGVVAIVALAFLIPSSALYGLLRDRPVGRSTSRHLWMAWRWRFAIGGACVAAIALGLLAPSTHVAIQFRIGATVGLLWGLLCLWVAALAFQAKLESQAPRDNPSAVMWWSAHWTRVVLTTIAVTVAWLFGLFVLGKATHG